MEIYVVKIPSLRKKPVKVIFVIKYKKKKGTKGQSEYISPEHVNVITFKAHLSFLNASKADDQRQVQGRGMLNKRLVNCSFTFN